MVVAVLTVPVLMGAFLLLMERFEARLLGVAHPWDVDDELLGPDGNHTAAVGAVGGARLSQRRADRGHHRVRAGPAGSPGPPAGSAIEAGTST
jgi:hypothetical protein